MATHGLSGQIRAECHLAGDELHDLLLSVVVFQVVEYAQLDTALVAVLHSELAVEGQRAVDVPVLWRRRQSRLDRKS